MWLPTSVILGITWTQKSYTVIYSLSFEECLTHWNEWIDKYGDGLEKRKYFPFFDLKEIMMARQKEIITCIDEANHSLRGEGSEG